MSNSLTKVNAEVPWIQRLLGLSEAGPWNMHRVSIIEPGKVSRAQHWALCPSKMAQHPPPPPPVCHWKWVHLVKSVCKVEVNGSWVIIHKIFFLIHKILCFPAFSELGNEGGLWEFTSPTGLQPWLHVFIYLALSSPRKAQKKTVPMNSCCHVWEKSPRKVSLLVWLLTLS